MGKLKERMDILKNEGKSLWSMYQGVKSKKNENIVVDFHKGMDFFSKDTIENNKIDQDIHIVVMARLVQLCYDLELRNIKLNMSKIGTEASINIDCFSSMPFFMFLSTNNDCTIDYSSFRFAFDSDLKGEAFEDINDVDDVGCEKQKTYIMKDLKNKCYKIGKSINPKVRERTLQSEKPSIVLLAVCNQLLERELHKKYKDYRIRGEWFELSERQVNKIIHEHGFEIVK